MTDSWQQGLSPRPREAPATPRREIPGGGVIAEGFGVPLLQSTAIAGAFALAGGVGLWAFDINGRIVVVVAVALFLTLFGALMAVFTGHWRDARWWVERTFQVDLDKDGHKGKPPERTIQIQVMSADGKRVDIIEIETVPADQMCQIAAAVVDGAPLTHAEFVKRRSAVTDPSFRALQGELVQKALAAWRDPQHHNQGLDLTDLGWTVFRGYAAQK